MKQAKPKFLLLALLLVAANCAAQQPLSLKELPLEWWRLVKTDSGYVCETHFDLGIASLLVEDSSQIKLIADQTVIAFTIERYTSRTTQSFECLGEFSFDGRALGMEPQTGTLKFEWVDQTGEIGRWTLQLADEPLSEYFTTVERIRDYPIILLD